MNLTTIEGHERPITILNRALASKTLAQAYLFSGEAGVGKKMTALALAAAVNCMNSGIEGGCGACPSCSRVYGQGSHWDKMIERLNHFDLPKSV